MLSTPYKSVKHTKQYLPDNVRMTLQNRINKLFQDNPDKKPIDLAKYLKISRASVSGWTTGKTKNIEGENAFGVARFFNVSPEWVQTGKGEKQLSQVPSTNFSSLMAVASPKTHAVLETLEKAYQQGQLTEDDLKLLDSIAKRLISETPKTQST